MSDFSDAARSLFAVGLRKRMLWKSRLSIMRPQVSRIENYPEVAQRLEEHIRETEARSSASMSCSKV